MCHLSSSPSRLTFSTQSKSQRWFESRGTTVTTSQRENLFRLRYARYYFVVLFESPVASKPGKSEGEGGDISSRNPTIEPLRGPVIGLLEITMGAPSVVFKVFVFVSKNLSQNDDP